MDMVGAMLDGHRARGASVLRCAMAEPWAVQVEDGAEVTVLVVVHGGTTVVHPSGPPVRLASGDVIVVKGTHGYRLGDDPATEPLAVIEPGQVCRTLDGVDLSEAYRLGVRTWGNSAEGPDAFLVGTYELAGQVSGRLLDAVPDLLVIRAGEWQGPSVQLLVEEFDRDAPGQDVVLDRLVDLVLVTALRTWFARHPGAAPAWWRGQQDPVVGDALRLIHDRPAEPWTVATLAGTIAVSRATLARRFSRLIGLPPMAYLTEWRLTAAADLLRGSPESVEAIARRVGYANPFAFSTAFKRRFGAAPRDFRTAGAG